MFSNNPANPAAAAPDLPLASLVPAVTQSAPGLPAAIPAAAPAATQNFNWEPQSFQEALKVAELLASADLVPKEYRGNAANCFVAMQWGAQLGLKTLQALQNLAVINGRPALWGDTMIALVRGSPLCEYILEERDGDTAVCRVKRRGEAEQVRTFSIEDAKRAGLWNKQGPWTQYPDRMLQMRARAFALRDVFPDVLRGIPMAEEVQDIPVKEIETVQRSAIAATPAPAPEAKPGYPAGKLEENLPKWHAAIASGRKSADEIVAMIKSKYTLTQQQIDAIRQCETQAEQSRQPAAATPAASAQPDAATGDLLGNNGVAAPF